MGKQKQASPKSLRLSPDELAKSAKVAESMELSWHGWVRRLIRWSNEQKPKKIKRIVEQQEKVD